MSMRYIVKNNQLGQKGMLGLVIDEEKRCGAVKLEFRNGEQIWYLVRELEVYK